MGDRVLRDHSQSCEHENGNKLGHYIDGQRHATITGLQSSWCPGGREVTIDYEAAVDALDTNTDHAGPPTWEDMVAAVRVIVDAALGEV